MLFSERNGFEFEESQEKNKNFQIFTGWPNAHFVCCFWTCFINLLSQKTQRQSIFRYILSTFLDQNFFSWTKTTNTWRIEFETKVVYKKVPVIELHGGETN
jgi:hypothetical protein